MFAMSKAEQSMPMEVLAAASTAWLSSSSMVMAVSPGIFSCCVVGLFVGG